jgi:tRNA/tmRNA/rRNA uracil-C5-methylase (TrmA/RlmC/RlmD family)
VRFAVDAEARLALRKHRSHDLVRVEHCPIATSGVDEVGATAVTWPGAAEVEVVASSGGDRTVLVEPAEGRHPRLPAVQAANVVVVGADKPVRGRGWVREAAAGRDWRVDAAGFWQVHPGAADALVGAVLEGLAPRAGETALDLYSGAGLFTGALADVVGASGTVVAVEGSKRAAADARRNLHTSPQVRIEAGSVEKVLPKPSWLGVTTADLVVLDPPRTGAGRGVVERVAALAPRAVAYVACDPAALARDLKTFAEQGYALASLRAFDLFPMTQHVECVAVLVPGAT